MKKENKLKTLKDLTKLRTQEGDFWILDRELKALLIKWIKEDRGLRKDNTIWRLNQDELLDLLEDRWMKRLDIIEGDLK